jgi:sugar transferase EpsL
VHFDFKKRMVDILFSTGAIIVCAPVIVLTALLIRISIGSPVLFRQVRPGQFGRPFRIYKFRTMTDECDENGDLLSDGERLTLLGRILRATSLDEVPELFNVLKGDMSLVGPRPLLTQYLDRYTPEQARRHEVKPGITGWAQINGRNAITWEEKFKHDVWYVDNQSILLDLKILFLTVSKILKRENISQPGHVTSEEFMGTVSHYE